MRVNYLDRYLLYVRTNTSIYIVASTNDRFEAEDIRSKSIRNPDSFDLHIYDQCYDTWLNDQLEQKIKEQYDRWHHY